MVENDKNKQAGYLALCLQPVCVGSGVIPMSDTLPLESIIMLSRAIDFVKLRPRRDSNPQPNLPRGRCVPIAGGVT